MGLGYEKVGVLSGGMEAWKRDGLPVELGLSGVMSPPDDVVYSDIDRGPAEMVNVLKWEEGMAEKYRLGSA